MILGHSPPRVSVIVPVFNGERFVARAIESVLNQQYAATEIVIVDDGSTDRSASVVAELVSLHSQIKLVSQDNSGVSVARNTGLHHATGEMVMFLDADDVLLPHTLRLLVPVLTEGVAIVFGEAIRISESDRLIGTPAIRQQQDDSPQAWISGNPVKSGSGALVLRETALGLGGFDTRLRSSEGEISADWWFYLRVRSTGAGVYVAHPTVAYRQVDGSMSSDPLACLGSITALQRRVRDEMPGVYPPAGDSELAVHAGYMLGDAACRRDAVLCTRILLGLPGVRLRSILEMFRSDWSRLYWRCLLRRPRSWSTGGGLGATGQLSLVDYIDSLPAA